MEIERFAINKTYTKPSITIKSNEDLVEVTIRDPKLASIQIIENSIEKSSFYYNFNNWKIIRL